MQKCSEEAFVKCHMRHLCGSPGEACFAEGSDCDRFNRQIMNQPITNADSLRAMSDEELADYEDMDAMGLNVRKSVYPDGDMGVLECPRCGSGEYLTNEDGNRNCFCGQCGQALDWTEPEE